MLFYSSFLLLINYSHILFFLFIFTEHRLYHWRLLSVADNTARVEKLLRKKNIKKIKKGILPLEVQWREYTELSEKNQASIDIGNPLIKSATTAEQDIVWEVESIVKIVKKKALVRWKGWKDPTWEPVRSVQHLDIFTSFLKDYWGWRLRDSTLCLKCTESILSFIKLCFYVMLQNVVWSLFFFFHTLYTWNVLRAFWI